MSLERTAAAYGVSTRTILDWRKRGVITADELLCPRIVAQKLLATAKNRSPKLERLHDPKTQLEIIFRLGISGLKKPTQKS